MTASKSAPTRASKMVMTTTRVVRFVQHVGLVCVLVSIGATTHASPLRPQLGTRALASQLLVRAPDPAVRELAPGEGSARLLWPVEHGSFVRGFGFVRAQRKELPHLGVDIAAKPGTPIRAAADGVVAYASDEVKGYGNLAILVHADGAVTSYAHCNKLFVSPGQAVHAGEVIGEVGSTGISRGPHLHFEYRQHGKPANPMGRFERGPSAS